MTKNYADSEETKQFLDYARDCLKLDVNKLDEEIMSHPHYVDEIGTFWAKLVSIAEKKEVLIRDLESITKDTEAQVESEVRADPAKFNIEKVTEGSIAMAVRLDVRCKNARSDAIAARNIAIEARENSNEAEVLYKAIQSKQPMIRHLVLLYVMSYRGTKDTTILPGITADHIAGIIQARIKGAGQLPDDQD